MRTIPPLRSPYSAEGTPAMISMDSMLSTGMFLVPVPSMAPNEPLLPSLTPSTSMAVPKAAFPMEDPPSRTEIVLFVVRSGLTVFPPGRRAATSVTFDICRCSSALLPNVMVVFMSSLLLSAVTITSSRARVFSSSLMTMSNMSVRISMFTAFETYPRHENSNVYCPAARFSNENAPESSDTVQSPVPFIIMAVPGIASPVFESAVVPEMLQTGAASAGKTVEIDSNIRNIYLYRLFIYLLFNRPSGRTLLCHPIP